MYNKNTKTKTFEFLTLFTMVIGTVVGSGIYMKNNEILKQTHNPIIGLILWSFVGVICIMSVVVFIEISSATKHMGNGTLGNWAKIFINRRTASFFSLMYGCIYIPSTQGVFVAGMVNYLLLAIGLPIPPIQQLIIYITLGGSVFFSFTVLNIYKRHANRYFQLIGIGIKFIPLLIAFIAGFILIDKAPGGTSAWWNNGGANNGQWSTTNFSPIYFLGGFGGILFAFDGYVYIANGQKTATHKDVVPKALFGGMIFVVIFYILMALALFMGSPDGSIVKLFEKMLSNGNIHDDPNNSSAQIARIIANLILMSICLLSSNIFIDIALIDLASDANNKLIYTKNRRMSYKKAGFLQLIISFTIYVFIIIIGICTTREGWNGLSQTANSPSEIEVLLNKPSDYFNWFSSGTSAIVFVMVLVVMLGGLINRKTKKVEIERQKLFLTCGIISCFFMAIFIFFGIFSFIWSLEAIATENNWRISSEGLWFLILLISGFLINILIFLVQEHYFKKDPFADGFEGELTNDELEQPQLGTDLKAVINKLINRKGKFNATKPKK